MADHYGSAEIIAGRLLSRHAGAGGPQIFTKWCPEPGPMTADVVRAGVQERLDRLGTDCIDLLQFHWWSFEHPAWLDALHEMARLKEEGLIKALGVTNFDAAHLRLALADGIPLVTNQVSFSMGVIDTWESFFRTFGHPVPRRNGLQVDQTLSALELAALGHGHGIPIR